MLVDEFAVLFEINSNAETAEGLAAIAGAAEKLDASTFTPEQRKWLASNLDRISGTGYALFRLGDSVGSFVGAVAAAADDVEQNLTILLGYFKSFDAAIDDGQKLWEAVPAIENGAEIFGSLIALAQTEGLEPPNEEQSKLLADKAATSAIGEEVVFS